MFLFLTFWSEFHVIWMIYILPRISETAPSWYLRRLFEAIFYSGRKINLPLPPLSLHHNTRDRPWYPHKLSAPSPLQGPGHWPRQGRHVLRPGDALQGDRGHGAPDHGRVVSNTSAAIRGLRGDQAGAAPPLQIRPRGEFRQRGCRWLLGTVEAILSWEGCQKDYVWINLETLENQYQPLVAESANQIKYKVSRQD